MTMSPPTSERWARFRFAVVGPLLAAPPARGELRAQLAALAERTFEHPITREPLRVSFSALERWYYTAKRTHDPFAELKRKVRKDAGRTRTISPRLAEAVSKQYAEHPTWSYDLHHTNLVALADMAPDTYGTVPSYATVRRFMKANGWYRQRRRSDQKAATGPREVRSYERPYANALWHLDFHHAPRKILRADGTWTTPKLLGILDDHTRVCCHVQWFLEEGTRELVHGLVQAFLKRGLPRALLMDNGSAMTSGETVSGLERLGVKQQFTAVESPWQNGKQEKLFDPVDGRLMAMLEGVEVLDLDLLNRATIAWVEGEYHRELHDGIGQAPLKRWQEADDIGRPAPSADKLRSAFRVEVTRKQRRSDATVSIDGVRFEVPWHYRHIERLRLRYARWDLSRVSVMDPRHDIELCVIRPVDKARNADGRRALAAPEPEAAPTKPSGIAPKLQQLMAEYAATGLPPALIPLENADE